VFIEMKDLLLKLNQLSNVTLYVCNMKDKKMHTIHDGAIFEAETPAWMQSFVGGDKMILVFEQKGQRKQYFRWKVDEETYVVILDDIQHTSLNLLLNSMLGAIEENSKITEIALPDPSLPDVQVLQEKIAQLTQTLEEEKAGFTAEAEAAANRYAEDTEKIIHQYTDEFETKAKVQAEEFEGAIAKQTKEFEEAMAKQTKEFEEAMAQQMKELEEEKNKIGELSASETTLKQTIGELEKNSAELKEQNNDQSSRLKDTLAKNLELVHQINELTAAAQKGITVTADVTKLKEENIRLLAQVQDWEERFKEINNKYTILQKNVETAKAEAAQRPDIRRPVPKLEVKPQAAEEYGDESRVVEVTEGDKKSTEIHIHINQPAEHPAVQPNNENSHAGIKKQTNGISHPQTVPSSPVNQHMQAMENRGLVDVVQALTAIITTGDSSHIDLEKLSQFVSVPKRSDLERNPAAVKTVIAKLLGMERSGQLKPEQIAKLNESVQ
jgi:myosin heavy subunit